MSASEDYNLLRQYEPILVYSPDERFFPMSAEAFVRQSKLWSVPAKLGSLPLVRRRWTGFDPEKDLDAAIGHMTSERASKGFVYLQYVDHFALFPLFWQAWALVAIETGLALLPLSIFLRALFELARSLSSGWLAYHTWPDMLTRVLISVSLALALGGTVSALARRVLRGREAYSQLPEARMHSFHTLATLGLMSSAIVGALAVGPLAIFRDKSSIRGVVLWVIGWLLAVVLVVYIPQFFRSGILRLSSLFALLSGLNDGTADAAFRKSVEAGEGQHLGGDGQTFLYYGRVWPEDAEMRSAHQYVILQYWFFYAFNDWRTRYNGVDDHEGDWEHVALILSRNKLGGPLQPTYLLYSQHILPGAFLRRAWDDPAVTKVLHGDSWHPVAYVAAGSHAHYYNRGKHGLEELLRFSKPASRFYAALLRSRDKARTKANTQRADVSIKVARTFDMGFLGEYLMIWPQGGLPQIERMDIEEFVDYAAVSHTDPLSQETGPSIGPGQVAGWECVLIRDDSPEWMRYNGNWGKYVAYLGESAPRGPRFASKLTNRDEWSDPINAAGLLPLILRQEEMP